MFLRSCAMAIAVAALAGCATEGYYAYPQPAYSYYDDYYYYDRPYYGGFGHGAYFHDFDDDDDRYFRPSKNVICDRLTETCSKGRWTKRIFGDEPSQRPRVKERDRPSRSQDNDRTVERLLDLPRERLSDDDDGARFALPAMRGESNEPRRLFIVPGQPKREKPGNK